jgi:hypothetical protein
MNDLISYERNLPENIEDVAKFVVIGAEKLNALRAEIRAIKKASIAKEVYDRGQNLRWGYNLCQKTRYG